MDLRSPEVARREFDLASRHCTDHRVRSIQDGNPSGSRAHGSPQLERALFGPTRNPEEPKFLSAQAARDRQRDRAMIAEGFRVVRFTGQEIYRDVEGCAEEVGRLVG